MPKILGENWKSALTSILQELKVEQYKMLLGYLSKIPQGLKNEKSREEMPQTIIEHYGEEDSISKIKEAMEEIPRRDSAIQDLLRPFVDRLKNKHDKHKKGKKRKHVSDPVQEEQRPAAEMSIHISEREWKPVLTCILDELDESEYKKMLSCCCFDEIPKGVKTGKPKEEMPQMIIQYLGVDGSISAIKEAMEQIPRRDPAVQNKLRPCVDKLRNKHEEENKDQPQSSQTDKKFEQKWKTSLTSILDELDESEYKKMLFSLDKIPKGQKTGRSREDMPQIIIQNYGVEQSVLEIKELMELIPRRDAAVQDRLSPFVDQLKKHQTQNKVEETHEQSSKPGSSGKKHFVDKHKLALIGRVSNIESILDELCGDVLQDEAYDKIKALPTSQARMRALYDGPLRASEEVKDIFYKLLQKNEKYLIRDLEKK